MKILKFFSIIICLATLWYSCTNHDLYEPTTPLQLSLRWVKSYPAEDAHIVVKGLAWNLSYLGASLPEGSLKSAINWQSTSEFVIDFSRLGFSEPALGALQLLIGEIKRSEEYRVTGSIDAGRFVVLTLNSSYHYYAITGASPTLNQFRSKFEFWDMKGAIINSSIAKGHREIQVTTGDVVSEIAFIASEGSGSLVAGTFVDVEYEALDVMPNGQLRFALYDKSGKLKASGSPDLSLAGKPAKCLWCHEINLQTLNVMESVPEYLSYAELLELIDEAKISIAEYRKTLRSEIDFNQAQDHTLGELLYISFMEPSAYRLANEWDMGESEVVTLLHGLSTHQHVEFAFFGNALYRRKDVEDFSPYESLPVPDDAREPSSFEPEIIRP